MGAWPPCTFRLITPCLPSCHDSMTRLPLSKWSTGSSSLPSMRASSLQLASVSPFSRMSRWSRQGPAGLFQRRTMARHPRSSRPFVSTLRRSNLQEATPSRRCAMASPPAGPKLLAVRSRPTTAPLAARMPQSCAAGTPVRRLRDKVSRSSGGSADLIRLQRASHKGRIATSVSPQLLSCRERSDGASPMAVQKASGSKLVASRGLALKTSVSICGHVCNRPPTLSSPAQPNPVS
mmetsp:Transcript_52839/g.153748  ORF Transcript_52839/g.153748 Transcript_52839/m.153748 type:complete len:235 (+) Transcript_52839:107-811(+)